MKPKNEFGATFDFSTALWKSRTKASEPLFTKMYYTVSIPNLPSPLTAHCIQLYGRLLLCLSNKQTLSLIDKLGKNHDHTVLQWRDDIITRKLEEMVIEFTLTFTDNYKLTIINCTLKQETISEPEKDTSATLQPATQPLTQPILESATPRLDDQQISSSSSSESGSGNENSEYEESSEDNGASSSSSSYSYGSSFEEDILHIFGPECSYAPTPSSMKTYKLTGDNLDKNVKPTEYRVDSQTKSLHYFQTYAVRDRIDLSSFDDTPPVLDESSINIKRLLPSESNYKKLTKNFTHHVVRILKEYMPFFSSFGSDLERHIRHQFYEEMSQKSEVVSIPND